MTRKYLIGLAIAVVLSGGSLVNAQDSSDSKAMADAAPIRLAVAAQPVAAALNEFARQSGLHVVIGAEVAAGVESSEVRGTFTAREGLERLLERTGLRYEYLDARTVAV